MKTDLDLPGGGGLPTDKDAGVRSAVKASRLRKVWDHLFGCPRCTELGYKCRDCWYDEAH